MKQEKLRKVVNIYVKKNDYNDRKKKQIETIRRIEGSQEASKLRKNEKVLMSERRSKTKKKNEENNEKRIKASVAARNKWKSTR